MKRYKSYLTVMAVILCMVMVLAACGDDSSYVNQTETVTTNVTEVTDTTTQSEPEPVDEQPATQVVQAPPPPAPSYKHDEYLSRAYSIEEYSRNNLDTAMTQVDMNIESGNVFTMWDNLLNEVYQHLEATMNSNDFAALQADEIRWIKEKESAIDATAAEWYGGSGAPAACNATGISYTKDRCYYLISLVK